MGLTSEQLHWAFGAALVAVGATLVMLALGVLLPCGTATYKANWMNKRVPLYTLTAYDLLHPLGVAGIVRSPASRLMAGMRRRYRRLRPRPADMMETFGALLTFARAEALR